MKHLRKFNESKKISRVEKFFLDAYQNGHCSVPDEFENMASEFYVYDYYYLYDNNIYSFSSRPSGDWHHTEIKLCEFKPSGLIDKLTNRIKDIEEDLDKVEKAIEKLAYGHDV